MSPSESSAARRNVLAGTVGSVLEWYDFALYGYLAPIIGTLFFRPNDPVASLLAAFGVFAIGFAARPVGGVVFGLIGDRIGRKPALIISVVMMGVATFAIGVMPDHAQIGASAAARAGDPARPRGPVRRRRVHGVDHPPGRARAARAPRVLRRVAGARLPRRLPARLGDRRPHQQRARARADAGLGLARAIPPRRGDRGRGHRVPAADDGVAGVVPRGAADGRARRRRPSRATGGRS